MPWITPGQTISRLAIVGREAGHLPERECGERRARSTISSAASTLPIRRPTTIIEIIVPTPRGASDDARWCITG